MESYKLVYFDQYCETCRHRMVEETDPPCNECLENPANLNSHKPVKYEEKKGRPQK